MKKWKVEKREIALGIIIILYIFCYVYFNIRKNPLDDMYRAMRRNVFVVNQVKEIEPIRGRGRDPFPEEFAFLKDVYRIKYKDESIEEDVDVYIRYEKGKYNILVFIYCDEEYYFTIWGRYIPDFQMFQWYEKHLWFGEPGKAPEIEDENDIKRIMFNLNISKDYIIQKLDYALCDVIMQTWVSRNDPDYVLKEEDYKDLHVVYSVFDEETGE